MESAVAAYATQLLTVEALDQWQVIASLTMLRDSPRATALIEFSRTLQELAVYEKGAILRKLLQQLPTNLEECLAGMDRMDASHLLGHSAFAFIIKMCCSDVLALALLKQDGAAEQLCSLFSSALLLGRNESETFQVKDLGSFALEAFQSMITWGLEGLFNFAVISREFRDTIRTASVFPAMLFLLKVYGSMPPDESFKLNQTMITNFTIALALSPDSIEWVAGDPGFVELLAGGFTCVERQYGQKLRSDTVELELCTFVLMRLFDSTEAFRKLKECGAVEIFEPCSKTIDLAFPERRSMWAWMKSAIINNDVEIPRAVRNRLKLLWKQRKAASTGAPTVCSWEHCTAEPQSAERLLSVCGGCGVSRYCRSGSAVNQLSSHLR